MIKAPYNSVRFDSSLSLWQRCIEMYKAIMGTHYIEGFYKSHKEKQSSASEASLFSDFCEEDWIFYFIPDTRSLENAEIMLYTGTYSPEYKYKSVDKLEDNKIYIQVSEDKEIFYTLKSLQGQLIKTDINGSTLTDNKKDFYKQLMNEIQKKNIFKIKKLFNYIIITKKIIRLIVGSYPQRTK